MNDEKPRMVRVYPKPNCPRCYGRGYIGEAAGCRVECSCLLRKKAHIPPICGFCGRMSGPDDMEPEEGDRWACSACWKKFRAEDRAAEERGRGEG